jgi:hypothetical protein
MTCPIHQLDNLMRRMEYINREPHLAPEDDDWLSEPPAHDIGDDTSRESG